MVLAVNRDGIDLISIRYIGGSTCTLYYHTIIISGSEAHICIGGKSPCARSSNPDAAGRPIALRERIANPHKNDSN